VAETLTIEMRAKDRASRDIKKVERSLSSLGKSAKEFGARFGPAIAIAGAAFTAFAVKAVKASAAQQTIMNQLRQSLERVGVSYDDSAAKIRRFTADMQATTRFGDDEMARVVRTLTDLTGEFSDATLRSARTVADFAEGAMMPLNSAARLVAQAIAGNISSLSRYLPALREVDAATFRAMETTERTALVLDTLSGAFGGSSSAISAVDQGFSNLKNTAGDVTEAFGKMITELTSTSWFTKALIKDLQNLEDHFNVSQTGVVAFEDAEEAVKQFGLRLEQGQVSTEEFNATMARFKAAGVDAANLLTTKFGRFAEVFVRASNRAVEATDEWIDAQRRLAGTLIEFGDEEAQIFESEDPVKARKRREKAARAHAAALRAEADAATADFEAQRELDKQLVDGAIRLGDLGFKTQLEKDLEAQASIDEQTAASDRRFNAMAAKRNRERLKASADQKAIAEQQVRDQAASQAQLMAQVGSSAGTLSNLIVGLSQDSSDFGQRFTASLTRIAQGFAGLVDQTGLLAAGIGLAGGLLGGLFGGGRRRRSSKGTMRAAGASVASAGRQPIRITNVITFDALRLSTDQQIGREVDRVTQVAMQQGGTGSTAAFREQAG